MALRALALLWIWLALGCDADTPALPPKPPRVVMAEPVVPGDEDGDGLFRSDDNCPSVLHPDATDSDGDGIGNACDACPEAEDTRDTDMDGLDDCVDRCLTIASADNDDRDGDGVGDACDVCPRLADAHQRDRDDNGVGDACDDEAPPFALEEVSVAELQRALETRTVSCEAVIEQVLERIARFDLNVSTTAPIHAFVSFNARVRAQARALDTELFDKGRLHGPLHCVPLVIKDNYDSSDTETSAGSLSLLGVRAGRDGTAVAKLRAAGAILIGTTNMDELAKGVFGISTRTGRTGNAYNTERNAGGSSAGTAAALAASFAVLGTGTDNCSSLTLPAAYAGLVTIRSSYGLVSQDGIFPSNRLDAVAGPMARSVTDLTLMLDQMAGRDARDERTRDAERPESYLPALDLDALKGKRIGLLRRVGAGDDAIYPFAGGNAHTLSVFARATEILSAAGAEIVENVRLPELSTARSGGGFGADVDAYLSEVESPFESFSDVCETGRFAPFTYKTPDSCEASYENSTPPDSKAYARAEQHYLDNRAYVEAWLDELELDAFLYPVDALGGAHVSAVKSNCAISSVTGLPAMVLGVGHSAEPVPMPIGMQLLGRSYSESTLLGMAYAFEQRTQLRTAPVLQAPAAERVPRLEPAAATALRLRIGEASFEQVLAHGTRDDLDAATFRSLVSDVLADE